MRGHVSPDAAHDCAQGARLFQLLQIDDIDSAIEAGLMQYRPCPACDATQSAAIIALQQRLAFNWAARDRYLARNARLARIAAERERRRAAAPAEKKSPLPPSVAAVLARAKTKAAERGAK